MGFFSKALKAAMPKMVGNPIATAVAMVSVAVSALKAKKGQKVKNVTKGKKKIAVKKSKIVSKKQKQQMEVMERICQSAYGTYIRGVTTVAARYIGHPAVAIPASEMIKTMMEEAAPTVNYLVQLKAEPKKESNIKEEKKPRIDKYTSGRFEYMKDSAKGWLTGFTKAIKGEQVIDEKYTLENLFSGNLTVEDMPDFSEYMTMVGAVAGAKYRGLWNSAKGTYDGVKMLVTEPEKVLEVASDTILDFIEHPWESTKEFAGNIRDDVVDAVWRSTPQEISEDAGEILGDVLTGIATGGGGKAAAGGAKMAGNKLLALGKTGAKEFAEGLGDLGKIGAKNVVYVGATTGIENASKNTFRNRLMMMASETGDKAKNVTGMAKGAASKVDDVAKVAGKTSSAANNVTSVTGELIENAVIGTPIVEGSKKAGKVVKDEVVDNAENKIERKITQETVENKVVRGESGKGKGDGVGTSGAVTETKVDKVKVAKIKEDEIQIDSHVEPKDIENLRKRELESGVKISEEKSKSDIDDIRTKVIENNSIEKDKISTSNTVNETKIDNTKSINEIKPKWWHKNYVDNLSDTQILLGVKQSEKGLSTLESATRENVMSAGKAWVEDSYRELLNTSGNLIGYSSSDGMRAFRIQYKLKEGMWRANFQKNVMVNNPYPNPVQHSSQLKNVHIDILD